MPRLFLAASLAAVCASSPVLAQVKLEIKHPEGARTAVSTSKVQQTLKLAGQEVPTGVEVVSTTSSVTEKPGADGTVRVREKTEAIVAKMSLPGGLKVDYDSSKPDAKNDNPQLDAILDQFRASKGLAYTLVYGKDGKATAVEGTEKALETAPPAAVPFLKLQLDPEVLKRAANQALAVLPDGPVKKGEQWRRMEVHGIGAGQTLTFERFYEYQGTVEKGGKTLDKIGIFTSSVSFGIDANSPLPFKVTASDLKIGASTGTILFDRESGEIVETSENMRITGSITLNLNGMDLPGELDLTMDTGTVVKR